MERKKAIETLNKLIEAMQGHVTVLPSPERIKAIRLAIASLETDEAYQLEYESASDCKLEDLKDNALDLQAVMLNDLWDSNKKLKKQIEMLKLDRDCEKHSGKWIPVSERLPKENTWVLCWYEYFRYGDYECMQETYGVGFYDSYGHWGGDVSGHKSKAIAWQPLPEPYKVEEQTGENT